VTKRTIDIELQIKDLDTVETLEKVNRAAKLETKQS
jgi:hypothetical protein